MKVLPYDYDTLLKIDFIKFFRILERATLIVKARNEGLEKKKTNKDGNNEVRLDK